MSTTLTERIEKLRRGECEDYALLLNQAIKGEEVEPENILSAAYAYGDTAEMLQKRIEICQEQNRLQDVEQQHSKSADGKATHKEYLDAVAQQEAAKAALTEANQRMQEANERVNRLRHKKVFGRSNADRAGNEASRHRIKHFIDQVIEPLNVKPEILLTE